MLLPHFQTSADPEAPAVQHPRSGGAPSGFARYGAFLGAGPVGLMAAYAAMIQRASKVMIIDRHPDRLKLAEQIGVIPGASPKPAGPLMTVERLKAELRTLQNREEERARTRQP